MKKTLNPAVEAEREKLFNRLVLCVRESLTEEQLQILLGEIHARQNQLAQEKYNEQNKHFH